jgi:hypothetical protein
VEDWGGCGGGLWWLTMVDAKSALLYSFVAISSSPIDTAASDLGNWWGDRGEVVTSAQKMRSKN